MTFNFETAQPTDLATVTTNMFVWIYNSALFDFVKFFLIVYTLVLVADLILILMLKGVGSDIRKGLRGMDMPVVSKSKMEKKWDKIKARLKSENVSQYKVAILEADSIVNDILSRVGYEGGNITEKLEKLNLGQLDYMEELLEAHQTRNGIIHNEDFSVDEDLAKKTVAVYEKFLRYLEFI